MEAERQEISPQLIREVTQRIVDAFDPEKIILFGSWARGDERSESDLDLMVVMESDLSKSRRASQIYSLLGLRSWSLDVVVYTPHEYAINRKVWGTLPSLVEKESKVLYERT